jgi:hypothetical protein
MKIITGTEQVNVIASLCAKTFLWSGGIHVDPFLAWELNWRSEVCAPVLSPSGEKETSLSTV